MWSDCLIMSPALVPVENNLIPESLRLSLKELFKPGRVFLDKADCWVYGYDNSRHQHCPDAVVFPQTTDEIQALVQLCNQFNIPLVARGRGTNTTGASVPIQGGIVLSTEKMNRILEIDATNRVMRVEPGVTNQAVQQAAAEQGFFWAPDPSSGAFSSVGGNLACNAAGPRAVKYGSCRDNTLGLKIVTGGGDAFSVGVKTTKGVVGYDLTRLVIGSEGTLAIITEATLKLLPRPQAIRTLQASYRDIESATFAICAVMQQPTIPCALEFMDAKAIQLIHASAPSIVDEVAKAILIVEVDGDEQSLAGATALVTSALQQPGCIQVQTAASSEEAAALWGVRKALSPVLRKLAPKKINEDVVVPIGKLPEFIAALEGFEERYKIHIVNFGHAGNGNIHVNLLINPDDESQVTQAHLCLEAIFNLVLSLGGTLSGEHGVGIEKQAFIAREIPPEALTIMKGIKRVFDPNDILNPNKIFPI